MNEAEKNLHKVERLIKVLYVTQALTAVVWGVAAVLTSIEFVKVNGDDHTGVLAMIVLVVLLIVQQVCLGKARPLRDEWRKRVSTHGKPGIQDRTA